MADSFSSSTSSVVDDMSCFTVDDTSFDYDYESLASITNASQCNCSVAWHAYLEPCFEVCDYPETPLPPIEEVLFPGVVYALVFLLGTIGNALVIFVVNRFRRMRNVTNLFLASLSTADLCLIWLCVPIMFIKYMSHAWFLGKFACYSLHYVQQFTCFCSVLTLTMISIERYLAIAYPMRSIWLSSIGRAKKVIALIWISSAVLAIPTALRMDYDHSTSLRGEPIYWCYREFPRHYPYRNELTRAYAVYEVFLLVIFPVFTMSVCYFRVARIVHSSSKDQTLKSIVAFSKAATDTVSYTSYSSIPLSNNIYRAPNRNPKPPATLQKRSSRIAETNKKQIVQMLIAIVVLYTICWTPTIVDELLTSFGYICRTSNTPLLKYMRMSLHALAYCQSCINPIVYAFMSQNFRNTFKVAFSRMRLTVQGGDYANRMHSVSSASVLSARAQQSHRLRRPSHDGPSVSINTCTLTVPLSRRRESQLTTRMTLSRDTSDVSIDRRLFGSIDDPTPVVRLLSPKLSTIAERKSALRSDRKSSVPVYVEHNGRMTIGGQDDQSTSDPSSPCTPSKPFAPISDATHINGIVVARSRLCLDLLTTAV
uniref:G-protein coupled receptors family 1 profile domain-containing protein n=1 Tax=Plectus sambesii TaxID=2011161 RepID=A0A914URK0_9BILA